MRDSTDRSARSLSIVADPILALDLSPHIELHLDDVDSSTCADRHIRRIRTP